MSSKLRPDSGRERVTAGKRDRRIVIRRATAVQDPGTGEMITTWADLAKPWASWRRASANERLAAAEVSAEVTDVFTVDWTPLLATVTPLDRIIYQGKEYDLAECTEVGFRAGMMFRGAARAEMGGMTVLPPEDEG